MDYVYTGSPTTFIGGADSQRLNLPIRYRTKKDLIYWGETPFKMGYVRNVTLWVKKINDDGKEGVHVMRFKELKATRDTIENTDGSIESPNLIGINFLVEHGFKLIIDGKNKTAWLEKED